MAAPRPAAAAGQTAARRGPQADCSAGPDLPNPQPGTASAPGRVRVIATASCGPAGVVPALAITHTRPGSATPPPPLAHHRFSKDPPVGSCRPAFRRNTGRTALLAVRPWASPTRRACGPALRRPPCRRTAGLRPAACGPTARPPARGLPARGPRAHPSLMGRLDTAHNTCYTTPMHPPTACSGCCGRKLAVCLACCLPVALSSPAGCLSPSPEPAAQLASPGAVAHSTLAPATSTVTIGRNGTSSERPPNGIQTTVSTATIAVGLTVAALIVVALVLAKRPPVL